MEEYRVILFASRNKDNKDIEGFKERRKHFITNKPIETFKDAFAAFKREGLEGELCRWYVSTNTRDMEKVKKQLICRLVSDDTFDLANINSEIVSIAMKAECALSKRWAFDFDIDDETKLFQFISDIHECDETIFPTWSGTPHGFVVVVPHGFDTRKLLSKYTKEEVTLHRDDMICYDWGWSF